MLQDRSCNSKHEVPCKTQQEILNLRFRKDAVKKALRSSLLSLRASLDICKGRLYEI